MDVKDLVIRPSSRAIDVIVLCLKVLVATSEDVQIFLEIFFTQNIAVGIGAGCNTYHIDFPSKNRIVHIKSEM